MARIVHANNAIRQAALQKRAEWKGMAAASPQTAVGGPSVVLCTLQDSTKCAKVRTTNKNKRWPFYPFKMIGDVNAISHLSYEGCVIRDGDTFYIL